MDCVQGLGGERFREGLWEVVSGRGVRKTGLDIGLSCRIALDIAGSGQVTVALRQF